MKFLKIIQVTRRKNLPNSIVMHYGSGSECPCGNDERTNHDNRTVPIDSRLIKVSKVHALITSTDRLGPFGRSLHGRVA